MKKGIVIKIAGVVTALVVGVVAVYWGTDGFTFGAQNEQTVMSSSGQDRAELYVSDSSKKAEPETVENDDKSSVKENDNNNNSDEKSDVKDIKDEVKQENPDNEINKESENGNSQGNGRQKPESFNGQRPENFNGQIPDNFNGQVPNNFNGQNPDNFNGQMPGGFGGSNVEISENPSEVVKSEMNNTASALQADYDNAVSIEMSDSNNSVKIDEAGTYVITGKCSDGSITVKKETENVVLILKDLELTSMEGACVSINKSSEVKLIVEGNVKLTSAENPENEKSTDTEVADKFDGAAIKVKAGAKVYITGSGSLVIDASKCKNGIKSADDAETALTIDGPEITITAANDAINAEYDLAVLSGKLNIATTDDAIHADRILTIGTEEGNGPEIVISSCKEGFEGTVINVFSGSVTISSSDDCINGANSNGTYSKEMACSVNILGGKLDLTCGSGDGIDCNQNVNLIGGEITISTRYNGGDAGIDYDGTYYVSDEVVLNNPGGVAGPDNFGGMGGNKNFGDNGNRPDFGENGGRPDFGNNGTRPDFRNNGTRPDFGGNSRAQDSNVNENTQNLN
jgi:hypothetical protein